MPVVGKVYPELFIDAASCELSMRLGLPLTTLDTTLRKAAQAEGIIVLPAKILR
jgi:hypothetical protein